MNCNAWKLSFALVMAIANPAIAQGLNLHLPNRFGTSVWVIENVRPLASNSSLLSRQAQSHCFGTATILFGHSNHPDGGHNERNGGSGGRCYLNPERTSYALVAGLQNSQYGNTLVFAYGKRLPLLTVDTNNELFPSFKSYLKRFQLAIGFEAGSLYYEKYFGRGAVTAPFIFPNVSASFTLGKNLEVSAMQIFLPDRIKLWGHVIDVPPELAGNYEFIERRFDSIDHRPRPQPMIFLRWRF